VSSEAERFLGVSGSPPPAPRRAARWNVLSVLIPLAGWIIAYCVTISINYPKSDAMIDSRPIFVFGLIVIVASILGSISAFVALARSERLWGITALGFALNAPGLMLLLML